MLYFLIESLGWLLIIFLLIIMIVLYLRLHQQLASLRQNMTQLQDELQQHKDSVRSLVSSQPSPQHTSQPFKFVPSELTSTDFESLTTTESAPKSAALLSPDSSVTNTSRVRVKLQASGNADNISTKNPTLPTQNKTATISIEPDERSLPMVTSLFHSIRNWFLGGNLVVRVGVLVLLVGVVLLLRLRHYFTRYRFSHCLFEYVFCL